MGDENLRVTGSLILGAAGLLEGRRATTHWSAIDLLEDHDAVPTRERVVVDGDLITAAGVSAGIDTALQLAAELTSSSPCRRRTPRGGTRGRCRS